MYIINYIAIGCRLSIAVVGASVDISQQTEKKQDSSYSNPPPLIEICMRCRERSHKTVICYEDMNWGHDVECKERGVEIWSPSFVFAAELDTSLALSLVPRSRRKIKKIVLVQDENEVQEVLPATLALESGEGYDVEESSHLGLKSTLERLPVETLKLLCNSEGLLEAGVKRDLVKRLVGRVVSKSKRKERIDNDGQGNNVWGENNVGFGGRLFEKGFEKGSKVIEGDAKMQDWGNSDLQFLALERFLEKLIQATLEKAVGEIKRSVQVMQNSEKNRYWPREKFRKARDQFEYDEWYKVERILDNALVNRDWEMIEKVRDVAATRAFTLRVAKREGWNVVAGIRDPLDNDPMEVFFQEKLASARQSARNNRFKQPGQPVLFQGEFPLMERKGFKSPVEDFRVRKVLRSIKLVGAQGKEANWPRGLVPIEALKKYHNNPPKRVEPRGNISSSNFGDEKLKRHFMAYSLRISGATAAMRGGMSLTQIRTIEEWDSKAERGVEIWSPSFVFAAELDTSLALLLVPAHPPLRIVFR
ncbi:hypothetical protein C2G38_2200265 [Gigaspora rosea]|uniref:SAP domain-containing protein n=1 Tax=Gigaspora rosea TaxID=44941 RepID=A0A397US10_9GLOM|nr:hypothetical protein C2G38_2200265 [Gigaspora rosea]